MPAQHPAPSTQWPVLHPGLVLAEKLDELRIGFREFALRTGKPGVLAADVRAQVGRLGHVVGHLALHGKKGIFLEDRVGRRADVQKEREADAFLQLGAAGGED